MATKKPHPHTSKVSQLLKIHPEAFKLIAVSDNVCRWSADGVEGGSGLNEQQVESLAFSIARTGQTEACYVREVDDGFELIAGRHRFEAVKKLNDRPESYDCKHKKTPLLVRNFGKIDDQTAVELAYVENPKQPLSAMDNAKTAYRMHNDLGWSKKQVATTMGVTVNWVGNLIDLMSLPAATQRLIHVGFLQASVAINLLTVHRDKPAEIGKINSRLISGKLDNKTLSKELKGIKRQRAIEKAKAEGKTPKKYKRGIGDLYAVLNDIDTGRSKAALLWLAGDHRVSDEMFRDIFSDEVIFDNLPDDPLHPEVTQEEREKLTEVVDDDDAGDEPSDEELEEIEQAHGGIELVEE